MSYREYAETLEDLIKDLLQEIDLDNPVLESDDGEVIMLPRHLYAILDEMQEALNGYKNQSGN